MKSTAFALLVALVLAPASAGAAVITVDDGGGADYATIQAAVDAAVYGDVVQVAAGYYNERVMMKNGVVLSGARADCTVIDGTGIDYSTVTLNGPFDASTTIEGFRIQGGTGPGWSASGIWLGLECSATVRHNVLIGNTMGILVNYNNGDPAIEHNTIVLNNDCGIQVYVGNTTFVDGLAKITSNIIVDNDNYGIYRGSDGSTPEPPHPELSCNDVWGNGSNYQHVDPAATDISEDPLFCLCPGDLRIEYTSPCAGAGSGGSDIGAFPAGCGAVVVEERSWGVIKALYR